MQMKGQSRTPTIKNEMPRTEEELGDECCEVVLACGDVVVAEVAVRVRVVERNDPVSRQSLLLLLPRPLQLPLLLGRFDRFTFSPCR